MTSTEQEVSIFELGASLVRHRWSIARWMVLGAAIAFVSVLFRKPTYTSTASFIPQNTEDASRAGLATLAGQFGLRIGTGQSQANSPDFYADLLKSRVLLAPIASDTFTVAEAGRSPATLLDLFELKPGRAPIRLERGVNKLRSAEATTISPKTGVVQIAVSTRWPSLSLAIAQRLLASVNEFNLRTRQTQASEERRFTETRLNDARATLRGAEDRLQGFLQHNRQFISPELRFDQDRLEREVSLDQQIVVSLSQAYEEVRIREVRNTPVVTVIEPPVLPPVADPGKRALRILLGLVVGGFFGAAIAIVRDVWRRRRASGDPEAETFFRVLGDAKGDAARLVPGWRKRKAQ